jgi:ribosomal-protein-alanine N-acetyltransferase
MNLTIRKWRIDDKFNLAINLNDLRILNNLRDGLPYPYTENGAEDFIRAMLSANKDNTFAFAITLDDKVIGSMEYFDRIISIAKPLKWVIT